MRSIGKCLVLAVTVAAVCAAAGCATTRSAASELPDLEHERTVKRITEDEGEWEKWDREGPHRIRSAISGYLKSRTLDFLDMFEVGLSFGPVARVEAQYGIGFWGVGAADSQVWRLGRRSAVANEEATTVSFIPFPASLILFPAAVWGDEFWGTVVTLGGIGYEADVPIWPDPVYTGAPRSKERIRIACVERDPASHSFTLTRDSFTVGAEAHLLLGARARVMPLQIFDFIAGLVGWDLFKDDLGR